MDELLPNMAIMKSPGNWFLVAFSIALLAIIANICFTKGN